MSGGFNLNLTGEKVVDPSSGFAPLPNGKYAVTVYEVNHKEYGPNSNNAGRDSWNVQFRISDGQEGANRRIFQQIGLFPTWAPTDKYPDGADNFLFYQFFSSVQGKSEKDFRAEVKDVIEGKGKKVLSLPDDSQVLGTEVILVLGTEADTYAYNKAKEGGELAEGETQDDFKRNTIKRILPAESGAASGGGGKPEVIRL